MCTLFASESKILSASDLDFISMGDLGKTLLFLGGMLAIIGIVLILLGRTQVPIGRLPGDFIYRGKNSTLYFPLATSILVSVVLSILLYVIGRFRR